MKMCDFKIMEKALKLAWIKRIQDDSQASWKIIPNHIMHKHGSLAFLTKCNFATNTLALENLPIFYERILNYWSEFKSEFRIFFRLHFRNCLSCVYNCDDLSLVHLPQFKYMNSHIFIIISKTPQVTILSLATKMKSSGINRNILIARKNSIL